MPFEERDNWGEESNCEDCKWYKMIDSGYGYCKRFPPLNLIARLFPHIRTEASYTVVPWCQDVCGEFKKK